MDAKGRSAARGTTLTDDLPDFKGETYEDEHDYVRLKRQLDRIRVLMLDGAWRTLAEISSATSDPEASVSRELRYLREEKHGGFIVDKRPRGDRSSGLYEYKISKPNRYQQAQQPAQEAPPKVHRVTKTQAHSWLTDLMTLTNAAANAGVVVPDGVYEIETYLNERSKG